MVIDLSGLTFLDAGGCQALQIGRHHARSAGVPSRIAGRLSSSTRRMLDITTLLPLVDPSGPLSRRRTSATLPTSRPDRRRSRPHPACQSPLISSELATRGVAAMPETPAARHVDDDVRRRRWR
jgi:hypothetical protein